MTISYNRVVTVAQAMNIVTAANQDLFYSQDGKDKDLGCIGHLRGDFGSGAEFYTTWWPHCEEYKTQKFKDEFNNLINSLRAEGLLKNLSSMRTICRQNPNAQLKPTLEHTYGFTFTSNKYAYYLRCFTEKGDYNFYCYCYDKSKLEDYLSKHK